MNSTSDRLSDALYALIIVCVGVAALGLVAGIAVAVLASTHGDWAGLIGLGLTVAGFALVSLATWIVYLVVRKGRR